MSDSAVILLLLPVFFFGILLCIEIGRRLGLRRRAEMTERERSVMNTIEASIFAWLGLLVAFTFAGAASRFDTRRSLTVQEANAIGTAYLRLDLLPATAQPALREKFRQYTETRIAVYQVLPDIKASDTEAARAAALQKLIWSEAVTALKESPPATWGLVLTALNEMIDITATRAVILRTHTPTIVLGTLLVLSVVSSLLIGHGLARKDTSNVLLHTVGFALVFTVTMYVILDLDHPRVGLIRLDYADQALTGVLAGMR